MRNLLQTLALTLLVVFLASTIGCRPKPHKAPNEIDETNKSTTEGTSDAVAIAKAVEKKEYKMAVTEKVFGEMEDGTKVKQFDLTNKNGVKVSLITYGARIISLETPDKDNKLANIVLFRDGLEGFLANECYFNCIVGRYGNRIADGKFSIGDETYTLAKNNNDVAHLHGGDVGFDKKVWNAVALDNLAGQVGVEFACLSDDGEEGYPGLLITKVKYLLNDDNELLISYEAEVLGKPTVLNLTNHAYWNLTGSGENTILDHILTLHADGYLPVDVNLIPLGKVALVKDTAMSFLEPQKIGKRIDELKIDIENNSFENGGYDHCYVLKEDAAKIEFAGLTEELKLTAEVLEPTTGRTLKVYTDQPAVQFYSGNFLDGEAEYGGGVKYKQHTGFCLETQKYPDSPNQKDFPSTLLNPGETYTHNTLLKFGVEK